MFTWLKKQKEQLVSPVLGWVQIEVTTHCNAACTYCPHTLLRKRWQSSHFPLALFRDLLPSLNHTSLVFLQGWGEPLLHPNLFEMVHLCKTQNKSVGFTTNGLLLTKKAIHTIIDLQVDILGVSFAGTTPSTHNRIRKGTDFNSVVRALEYLLRIKVEKNTAKPAVHLAYILLASNFDELNTITNLAKKVGAQQVVASNLTLIQKTHLAQEALFNNSERLNKYNKALSKIKKEAADSNILFAYHEPSPDAASCTCPENVSRACVVNVAGEVSPCVFSNPILSATSGKDQDIKAVSIFKGQQIPLQTLSFGNIKKTSLTQIRQRKNYREFMDLFDPETRLSPSEILTQIPAPCKTCYKRMLSS